MTASPTRLSPDPILEVLLEIRFEHSSIPEVIVGQLVAAPAWAGYTVQRLPMADVPSQLRAQDANLRYLPMLQLDKPGGSELIRVGPTVISMHAVAPYPGWADILPRFHMMVDALYGVLSEPFVTRAGLRYVNVLTMDHYVNSVWDLDLDFTVASARPNEEFVAAYRTEETTDLSAQVTVASKAFISGPLSGVAAIDVDVFTPNAAGQILKESLIAWLERAHAAEKRAFFALLPDTIVEKLRER